MQTPDRAPVLLWIVSDAIDKASMNRESQDRFTIIRQLAVGAAEGTGLNQVFRQALELTADFVGLTAAALFIWNDDQVVTVQVDHARSPQDRDRLLAMEKDLFEQLRRTRQLASAYMSFGGDRPYHAFTLPLQYRSTTYGAVVGFQEGVRNIVSEDMFLETLSAILALTYAAGIQDRDQGDRAGAIEKERQSAVIETAVTVNHEVNNPLTAILGNVQLLLLKREDLDDELRNKLKTIEISALKIKDVTQKLMRLTSPRSIDYSDGTRMIDLNDGADDETES